MNNPKKALARAAKDVAAAANTPGVVAWFPDPADGLLVHADLEGPPGSPYAGGRFRVVLRVPPSFPYEAPASTFAAPPPHPNLDSAGRICLDLLKRPPRGSWAPTVRLALTISLSFSLLSGASVPLWGLN